MIAAAGVDAVIRRDDALKEQILRPMFGDEWPQQRMFPNRAVSDGETLEFGGASFTVIDFGPSESPHDSIWLHGCRALALSGAGAILDSGVRGDAAGARVTSGPRAPTALRVRPAASRRRVPVVRQLLRNNCETAALSMLLAARGVNVHQLTLQRRHPRSGPLDPQRRGAGRLPIWGDPDRGFVGRANGGGTNGGFGVYQGRSGGSRSATGSSL